MLGVYSLSSSSLFTKAVEGVGGGGGERVFFTALCTADHVMAVGCVVVCSLTSIQEARGKRSNHLLVSLSAIAQDNEGNQNTVS